MDIAHFLLRVTSSFNTESRYYWPLVIAVGVALVANIVWYYWPKPLPSEDERRALRGLVIPEDVIRPWAFWVNVIVLIWLLMLLLGKPAFWWLLVSLAVNLAILAYLYFWWLPPREVVYERELERRRYIPGPKRKRRRR